MKYNTVVIDPPWDISMAGNYIKRPQRAKELPYKTMSLKEIKCFPIHNFAEKGSHIYLWTTNKMLREAFNIFDSWNVRFHLMLTWIKPTGIAPLLTGYKFAVEFCLLGFYKPPMQKFIGKGKVNWIKAFTKKNQHSTKPNDFYKLVEQMSPSPRIDIFARQNRFGWGVWGDEIPKPLNEWYKEQSP